MNATILQARDSKILFIVSLATSLLAFSIFLLFGVPSVEDQLGLLKVFPSDSFGDFFTTTMKDQFNIYGSPLTSKTDIYRPFFEITFWIDEGISRALGINFYKWSNVIYFLLSIFVFSLFVNEYLGLKYAVLAILIFAVHFGHVHSQYSYVNRLGVLSCLYIFSILYLLLQLLKRQKLYKVLLIYLLSVLLILTKEIGVIVFMLPGFAFILYVFLHKLDLQVELKKNLRFLVLHTAGLFALVIAYLLLRMQLFDGFGNYHPGASISGIMLNLLMACQLTTGLKLMYVAFALPAILFLGYKFYESENKILLLLIFTLIIGLYGPSLLYSVGKRYSSASGMIFIFFFLYFLREVKINSRRWLLLASLAVPMAVQAIDIKIKQLAVFQVRPILEQQLSDLTLSADTIAVIMPMYLNDESILYKNGIIEYLGTLPNFQDKAVVVLGVMHDSKKYYLLGETKQAYAIEVVREDNQVVVNYPEDARFDIPHLPRKILEFDNKFFLYKNDPAQHKVTFDMKFDNFEVLYFEKLDYDKFEFTVL
ncbi:MAG: hypothetical protein JKX73_00795 [Flavobacteriales bacterium]|nr:hypothetical protein [Flavobacteriales bacterium]